MTDPVLIELPAALQTERLLMRPPQAGDGAAHHAALVESLPRLRRFLSSIPWVAADPSAEASEAWCRNAQANFIARRDLPYLLFERATGLLVGGSGLHRTVWDTPKTEVGYWIRSSAIGRGFASEAVRALTALALTHLKAVRIELITDEANADSRRVAERCGFTLEAVLRNERRGPDGGLRHTCVYARTADPG